MKFLTTLIFICFFAFPAISQVKPDSLVVPKVKNSWYFRAIPYSIYSGAGYQIDRVSQNLEIGRSYGPIDIGVAAGRINMRPDSSFFTEGRVTMDACQYGIFSNEFAIGAGYVFNSNTPIMLEVSSTIFAQIGKKWGLGVITGYYDFSGNTHDSNKNFYGIFFRYGFLRKDGGVLINKRPLHHHGK